MKTLEEYRAAFKRDAEGGKSSNNDYYPFWNMDFGQHAVVRFLPDKNEENPYGFVVKKHMHNLEVNGEIKKIPCRKMYGNDTCPICKVSKEYYDADDEDNGKKYWRKETHLAQVLVISDPLPTDDDGENAEGKVKYLSIAWELYGVIREKFESGRLKSIPWGFTDGYNFIIKKTKKGKYATYALGSEFDEKSDLTDDEIEFVESEMIDLSTLLPKETPLERMESVLRANLTGEALNEDNEGGREDDTPVVTDQKDDTVTTAAVDSTGDDEFDDEADEILSQIQKRYKGE